MKSQPCHVHPGALSRIVCPTCRVGRLASEPATAAEVRCARCGASFSATDGIIDLLPGSAGRRSPSQALMEWQPFIRIYETRLFRTGPGFPLVAGISFAGEYKMIIEAVALEGAEAVLDLGCGSGVHTRPLARALNRGTVMGLDLSVPMLKSASSRARAAGIDNVCFIHGNALDLPFPDGAFDAVTCCATIHHFIMADLPAVAREVRRVLTPGGRFVTSGLRNWIAGRWSDAVVSWHSTRLGTNYLREDDLRSILQRGGLNHVVCHHAKRYWLVMSAVAPQ